MIRERLEEMDSVARAFVRFCEMIEACTVQESLEVKEFSKNEFLNAVNLGY